MTQFLEAKTPLSNILKQHTSSQMLAEVLIVSVLFMTTLTSIFLPQTTYYYPIIRPHMFSKKICATVCFPHYSTTFEISSCKNVFKESKYVYAYLSTVILYWMDIQQEINSKEQ